jgi:1-acyl-sn-glycerol-3-phosphate acyltransferase
LFILTILTAVFTIILSPVFPNAQFSYFPARWWGRFFCYLLFIKVKITGLEKLDPKKSYVIAANHQSIYDIFVVYGWLPMIFKWVMKAELRKIPLVGKACESAGHIFIDRKNPVAAKKSLDRAEAQLRNGVSVVVFPEGTRTYTGQMGKFKKGAFRMATDLQLPIVPVTLRGCFERLPRNGFVVTPGLIEMIIHEPVEVEGYEHEKQPELMQKLHDIIESAL